jgi:hypothetical protein
MKEKTCALGLNYITAYNDQFTSLPFPHLFKKSELEQFYSDWNIIKHSEHPISPPRGTGTIKGLTCLIAQKKN